MGSVANDSRFRRGFTRLMVLPVFVGVGLLHGADDALLDHSLRNGLDSLTSGQCMALLIGICAGTLLVVRRWYRRVPGAVLGLLAGMLVVIDLLGSTASWKLLRQSGAASATELSNDMSFVMLIPVVLGSLLLVGWLGDVVKNSVPLSARNRWQASRSLG